MSSPDTIGLVCETKYLNRAKAAVTNADALCAIKFAQAINITNAEFLGVLFQRIGQDERLWTTEFVINPKDAKGKEWDG